MADLNPQLGRYFGISSGVLILSSNKGFAGLQAGDGYYQNRWQHGDELA